jgi:hypothetical protein
MLMLFQQWKNEAPPNFFRQNEVPQYFFRKKWGASLFLQKKMKHLIISSEKNEAPHYFLKKMKCLMYFRAREDLISNYFTQWFKFRSGLLRVSVRKLLQHTLGQITSSCKKLYFALGLIIQNNS